MPRSVHGAGPLNGPNARAGRFAAAAGLALAVALAGSAAGAPEGALLATRMVVWGFTQGETFRQPRGIAFDPRDGAIYVANTGQHRIEVFSRTGRPLARFVHAVAAPGGGVQDGAPCALAFDRAGHLLVADQAAAYVDVLDRRGRPQTRLKIPRGQPSVLAVAADGTIYVGTTAGVSTIYRFRADYAPAGSWGEQGEGPGHLLDVTAIGELADSTIAVGCGRTELGIQIFTPTGEYLRGFGAHELVEGNFTLPSGVVGTRDGRIWATDELRQELLVFDRSGNFLAAVGGRGTAPGEFSHPSSLAFDGKGLLAVTDRDAGRFQVLAILAAQPDSSGR